MRTRINHIGEPTSTQVVTALLTGPVYMIKIEQRGQDWQATNAYNRYTSEKLLRSTAKKNTFTYNSYKSQTYRYRTRLCKYRIINTANMHGAFQRCTRKSPCMPSRTISASTRTFACCAGTPISWGPHPLGSIPVPHAFLKERRFCRLHEIHVYRWFAPGSTCRCR